MNKQNFMEQLEVLLAPVSEKEREEALQYYRNYFEEAGEDKEVEVLEELETPEKVAKTIFDEIEYVEEKIKKVEPLEKKDASENIPSIKKRDSQNQEKKMSKARKIIMICTSPIWAPILLAIWIIIVSLIITMSLLAFTFALMVIVFVVVGVAAFLDGLLHMFAVPAYGICLVGASFILLAVAILFLLLVLLFVLKVIPGLTNLLSLTYTVTFKVKGDK